MEIIVEANALLTHSMFINKPQQIPIMNAFVFVHCIENPFREMLIARRNESAQRT